MKKLLLLFTCITLLTSLTVQTVVAAQTTTLTVTEALNLLDGHWTDKAYIDAIRATRSPYHAQAQLGKDVFHLSIVAGKNADTDLNMDFYEYYGFHEGGTPAGNFVQVKPLGNQSFELVAQPSAKSDFYYHEGIQNRKITFTLKNDGTVGEITYTISDRTDIYGINGTYTMQRTNLDDLLFSGTYQDQSGKLYTFEDGKVTWGSPSNLFGFMVTHDFVTDSYADVLLLYGLKEPSYTSYYFKITDIQIALYDIPVLDDYWELTEAYFADKTPTLVLKPMQAAKGIQVLLNNKPLSFEQPPVLENGRVLVPLRAIFEAMGATLAWDANTQTITATSNGKVIVLKVGDSQAQIDGISYTLDVPPQMVNGHTLVPLRFIAESFGCSVNWDGAQQTVTITN